MSAFAQIGTRDAWMHGLRESFPPSTALLKSHACFVIQGCKELAGTIALRGCSWAQRRSSRGIIDA
jgi:hypothetical protein